MKLTCVIVVILTATMGSVAGCSSSPRIPALLELSSDLDERRRNTEYLVKIARDEFDSDDTKLRESKLLYTKAMNRANSYLEYLKNSIELDSPPSEERLKAVQDADDAFSSFVNTGGNPDIKPRGGPGWAPIGSAFIKLWGELSEMSEQQRSREIEKLTRILSEQQWRSWDEIVDG